MPCTLLARPERAPTNHDVPQEGRDHTTSCSTEQLLVNFSRRGKEMRVASEHGLGVGTVDRVDGGIICLRTRTSSGAREVAFSEERSCQQEEGGNRERKIKIGHHIVARRRSLLLRSFFHVIMKIFSKCVSINRKMSFSIYA